MSEEMAKLQRDNLFIFGSHLEPDRTLRRAQLRGLLGDMHEVAHAASTVRLACICPWAS